MSNFPKRIKNKGEYIGILYDHSQPKSLIPEQQVMQSSKDNSWWEKKGLECSVIDSMVWKLCRQSFMPNELLSVGEESKGSIWCEQGAFGWKIIP